MHTVSSQFLSRSAADAAVHRLVRAGFERRDISIMPLDITPLDGPPRPGAGATRLEAESPEGTSWFAQSPGLIGAAVGGGLGGVLGGLGVPLVFAWLGQGHATHSTDVAIATGAVLAFVLGSRLGALVALQLAIRSESDGLADSAGWNGDDGRTDRPELPLTRPLVVVVRTVEALSRHAGRILERSGACHVSTEA